MNAFSNQLGAMPNRSMPPGIIIPELVYDDIRTAVAWLCQTFGFRERLRIGEHRSQLVFGEAALIVVARSGGKAPHPGDATHRVPHQEELTHSIMVRVADVDQHYAHAKQCGANILSSPADFPYGERQYTVVDSAGHHWTFSQSIVDVDPREWGGLLLAGADDPA